MSGPLDPALIREFLKEHPQYIPEVSQEDFGTGAETALSAAGVAAFLRWGSRTGRCDPAKSRRLLDALKAKFPRANWEG